MINVLILAVFVITIVLIVWNKIPRSIVALAGALFLVFLGEHYGFLSQEEALKSIDFNTIGLLMGMMILVAIIKKTGFLTFLAIKSAKLSRGNLLFLMIILGFVTAFLSMLIDNVTTLVIIGPTTILIADVLGVAALPFLITEVVFSNIGGVGTLIGDPPNIMIASVAGFSFNDFLFHLFPVVLITLLLLTVFVFFMFRKEISQANINFEAVMAMDEKKAIQNAKGIKRSLFCLGVVLVMFFFHSLLHLEPAFVALFGGVLALLLVRPDPDEIFKEVEWDVLFFFSALFILVEAVQYTGLFTKIAESITHVAGYNFNLCAALLMWGAAICSTFIGSIAFTAAAIPVIESVPLVARDVETLWWVLAVGAGFGGNGLPISSAAGVLCLSIMKKSGRFISMGIWMKTALCFAVVSLVIATGLLVFFRDVFF